jgi:hypothetical protein
MENQHRQIKGYRDFDQATVDKINGAKELAVQIGEFIASAEMDPETDKRWLAIAKTDLQKGCMALVRSIAKPDSF